MFLKNKFMLLLIVFAVSLTVLFDCFAKLEKQKGKKETKMVKGKNKDIIVHTESVTTDDGMTVGFRIEFINPSLDKNLVFVLHDNISYHFRVRLINKEGKNVSPRPQLMPANEGLNNRNKYDIIAPGVSHTWFIPVPNQVRVRRKHNDKTLQPTPNGKYMAKIIVSAPYFIQDKKEKVILKKHDYKTLQLVLPQIPIQINSKSFNQDIEKVYKETKK